MTLSYYIVYKYVYYSLNLIPIYAILRLLPQVVQLLKTIQGQHMSQTIRLGGYMIYCDT